MVEALFRMQEEDAPWPAPSRFPVQDLAEVPARDS